MSHFIPSEYRERSQIDAYVDREAPWVYQPHVYEFAVYLARRAGLRHIVDFGCGSAAKLSRYAGEFHIVGVDAPFIVDTFAADVPGMTWIACDLDQHAPQIPHEVLGDAVVICADVLEHLHEPQRLAMYLAEVGKIAPFVLTSTPDRDRVRGWLDRGPPANPAHVREWAASEYLRFLRSCGFPSQTVHGHTINTDHHRANTTLLTLSGRHAVPLSPVAPRSVAAILHMYNEVDIVEEVVEHLVRQGVKVCLFDNWSNDGTWEVAQTLFRRGLVGILDRYPQKPAPDYDWAGLLRHTQECASMIDVDWVLHYDADELRYSPWKSVSLADAISWIDSLGYNAIDFTVVDFRFLDGVDTPAVIARHEQRMTHFEFGRRRGHFVQVKGWKNAQPVELVDSGGHEARFPGRRVYPLKFLTKHYPLRTPEQARSKVFRDRLPRVRREQQQRGWHTQYNAFAEQGAVPGWSPHALTPWSEEHFMTEYVVQRLSGVGL